MLHLVIFGMARGSKETQETRFTLTFEGQKRAKNSLVSDNFKGFEGHHLATKCSTHMQNWWSLGFTNDQKEKSYGFFNQPQYLGD
jgi:hypothetical protein